MFNFFKNLLGFGAKETVQEILTPQAPYKIEPPTAPAPVAETKPERAKDAKGKFVADDPSTPNVNEAWKDGKAPAKKAKPAVTEGKQRANVKKPNPNSKKPPAPPAAKPKAKPKAKTKK